MRPAALTIVVSTVILVFIASLLSAFSEAPSQTVLDGGLGAYSYNVPSTDPTAKGFDIASYLDSPASATPAGSIGDQGTDEIDSNDEQPAEDDDSGGSPRARRSAHSGVVSLERVQRLRSQLHRANVKRHIEHEARRKRLERLRHKKTNSLSSRPSSSTLTIPKGWPKPVRHTENHLTTGVAPTKFAHLAQQARQERKQWDSFSKNIFSDSSSSTTTERDSTPKPKLAKKAPASTTSEWNKFSSEFSSIVGSKKQPVVPKHSREAEARKLRQAQRAKEAAKNRERARRLIEQMIDHRAITSKHVNPVTGQLEIRK